MYLPPAPLFRSVCILAHGWSVPQLTLLELPEITLSFSRMPLADVAGGRAPSSAIPPSISTASSATRSARPPQRRAPRSVGRLGWGGESAAVPLLRHSDRVRDDLIVIVSIASSAPLGTPVSCRSC